MSEGFFEQLIARADKRRTLDQGTYLFHQGDPVISVFFIEEGLVELTRHQQDGASIVLQRATRQTVLAEASVYSEAYHCDAVVELPSRVFELSKAAFLKHLQEDDEFSNLWAAHLAGEVQFSRYRSEILSRRTVWLSIRKHLQHSKLRCFL